MTLARIEPSHTSAHDAFEIRKPRSLIPDVSSLRTISKVSVQEAESVTARRYMPAHKLSITGIVSSAF